MVEALTVLDVAFRSAVGLIFLAAGFGKLAHRQEFGGVVANYRLLPAWSVEPVAAVLPPLEIAVGVALLAGWGGIGTVALGAGLLLIFAAAMAVNILRGRTEIDCGCFQSALRQPVGWALVLRNLGCVLALAPTVLSPGEPSPLALLNGLASGAVLFLIYQAMNSLWATRTWAWSERPRHSEG